MAADQQKGEGQSIAEQEWVIRQKMANAPREELDAALSALHPQLPQLGFAEGYTAGVDHRLMEENEDMVDRNKPEREKYLAANGTLIAKK